MLRKDVQIQRPDRWDVPFDEQMSTQTVDQMLRTLPFARMDSKRFPDSCSLRGILMNDTRVEEFSSGDLVVREGDYGNSAFLILAGSVRVTLDRLPNELLGRTTTSKSQRWRTLWRLLFRSRIPEYRREVTGLSEQLGTRLRGNQTSVFLQDVPGVLDQHRTLRIGVGEFFGEVAALSRTPRSASVFADTPATLLEIRWQGLRDLMRFDQALKDHIHQLYRQNSLASHLRQTPLLQQLGVDDLADLVEQTRFETFGEFEWHRPYKQLGEASPSQRIESEPLIAREGNAPNGLLLIRNGFARLSQQYGNGHRTCSYLGKGQTFGMAELYHQWKFGNPAALRYSLRAIGYVDVLRVPTEMVERHVLPQLTDEESSQLVADYNSNGRVATVPQQSHDPTAPQARQPHCLQDGDLDVESLLQESTPGPTQGEVNAGLETSMLEFVVDNRLMNGSQTMIINLDRCTRCDDCVRACADTHDNNPRFVRQGPVFGQQMFASACMHCADPVCMIGCPTGAISRDEQSGSVTIHDGSCIGCSTCANSCPYQAIRMVDIRDRHGRFVIDQSTQLPIAKATKCDLCSGLFGGPACARACPHDALVRIDLRQPDQLRNWLAR